MITINQEQIDGLVSRPVESLNVEVKRWIEPNVPSGAAKIVRGAFAIRNRNGGFLVVGFDDRTLTPDLGNAPTDVRALFHLDKIQGLISRHTFELFEIGVGFGSRDGQEYPVIVIPEGVRVPAVAKRPLIDSGRELISNGDVFFRTLQANGTPSTALARPEDWREILEICFENREADIGRFLRRHLAGQDLSKLLTFLGTISGAQASPSLREQAEALLVDGQQRFLRALEDRPGELSSKEKALIDSLTWSVALVIEPQRSEAIADQQFLATLGASNPNLTGWPVWLDARFNTERQTRPVVRDNGWEALIISLLDGWSNHVDFERFDPSGKFYLRRLLQDDAVPDRIRPGTGLDPILVILRVAEAIIVGLAFAKALGWEPATARLGFAFHWAKLKGRQLNAWAHLFATIGGVGTTAEDEARTYIELPLDTPASAIAPSVEEATRRLFALFDGYRVPKETIEEWVRRLIERRLS